MNGQIAPRREREKRQRRAEILRAAESVFAADGFEAASIEQIATTAEYATGTVYLYFRSKETLYLELFEEKVRELSDLIRRRTAGVKNPKAAIENLVAARMEYFEANRSFFRIYAREGMNCYESSRRQWKRVIRLYAEYLRFLAALIGKAQRQGLFRQGDARQLAVSLSGMMIELTRESLQSKSKQPLTGLTALAIDLFFNGVCNKTGK